MDDFDVERRVREAAPQPTAMEGLAGHRDRILREARRQRSRSTKVWVTGVLTTALIVSGGTAAMATSGLDTPWGWVADNVYSMANQDGSECFQGIELQWAGVPDDAPIVQDAQAVIRGMDLSTVDTTATEARMRQEAAEARDGAGATVQDDGSQEALMKQVAIDGVVWDTVVTRLQAEGYGPSDQWPISLKGQTTDCSR